jgi:soluble lytic murein transglycosylase-like protein
MIEDMYSVIQRINEIKKRFGIKRHNPVYNTGRSFEYETSQRMKEQRDSENSIQLKAHRNVKLTIPQIKRIVNSYSKRIGVPPSLVHAIIERESGYNQFAVSNRGAMGLMQLMPKVIEEFGISNPFVPDDNIRGGVSYLKRLLVKYGWDYKQALAAYNAGERVVDESRGIPPYKETRDYISRVINSYLENRD